MLVTNNTKGQGYGRFTQPCTCVASVSVCTMSYYLQPGNVPVLLDGSGMFAMLVGTHNVSFIAVDIHGNVASAQIVFIVNDNEAPVISRCLRNAVAATTGAPVTLQATDFGTGATSDNVGVTRTTLMLANSTLFSLTFRTGQWRLVYTVYDAANNSASCGVDVTVFLLTVPSPLDIVEGVLFQQRFVSLNNITRTDGFQFTLTDSTKIPAGLFLNEAAGVLSGVVSDTASASELGVHGPFALTITDTASSETNLSKYTVYNIFMYVLPPLVFYEPSATTQYAPMPRLNPTVKVWLCFFLSFLSLLLHQQ